MFFGFCNMAVFYSFYTYLGQIGIPIAWRGFLVSLEPLMAFSLRLFLIPYLTSQNTRSLTFLMTAACATLSVVLFGYVWAYSLLSLILLRIVHGSAFVLLISVSYTLLAKLIPPERSAQAFGLVSITALLPYSLVPLLTERLLTMLNNEAYVYAFVGVLGLPAAALAWRMRQRLVITTFPQEPKKSSNKLFPSLPPQQVLALLTVSFLYYFSYATVFYFIKNLVASSTVGLFFSLFSAVMLGMRLLTGKFMDRVPKNTVLLLTSAAWIVVFILLTQQNAPIMFYAMAVGYGLCVSLLFPILNAEIFIQSTADTRAANTNMVLFTMDAGYFLSPVLCGLLLTNGSPVSLLFHLCAGCILISMFFIYSIRRKPCNLNVITPQHLS